MLITADWVLPISRPPIRNGAVVVERGLIIEVGRASEIALLDREGIRHDFPGCVLLPGLVNAHTHLSLTAVGGLLAPAPFAQWLPQLVAAIGSWGPTDHAASAALGASQCLEAGVTVVGDIAYGPEAPSAAADTGLGGVFYWEVLGVSPSALTDELACSDFPLLARSGCGPRIRCGISPHSPYTSGPGLLEAVHRYSVDHAIPVAIHVAESADEVRLMRDGDGPLAELASRTAVGFKAPGTTPVRYLDDLGVLEGTTAVHLGHVGPHDILRLASTVRGAVACPRSNTFLHNPVAPVARLLRAGIAVGLGTDSSASNSDLDLLEEARALRAKDPTIPVRTLVEMVTAGGAAALGVGDRFGSLEKGMQADLAAFHVGATTDPEAALISDGGRESLSAVVSAGVWRAIDGRLIGPRVGAEADVESARARARSSLAGL